MIAGSPTETISNYAGCPQDKFHHLLPHLDTWSAYIVPATLITIGVIGIWENTKTQEGHDPENAVPELKTGRRAGLTTYVTGIVHGLQVSTRKESAEESEMGNSR